MIKADEVFKIGKLVKPHGIKGEIAFAFDNDVFDKVNCNYLICLIDDIFVPFFMKSYRFKGKETALVTFEDIDSEQKAKRLSGSPVYFPRIYFEEKETDDSSYSWNYFIGFTIVDENYGQIGVIEAVDELTMNALFLVKNGDIELIVPANEDFIESIDDKKRILNLLLPEGLF